MTTRLLDRTSNRHFSAFCAVTALTTPLYAFGFPTEIWICCALFWPTLCSCACASRSSLWLGTFIVLLPLFTFTHAAAILFFPLFVITAMLNSEGIQRALLLIAIASVLTCWLLVKMFVPASPRRRNPVSPVPSVNTLSALLWARRR